MNTWEKIKGTILREQLQILDGAFVEISKNVGSYRVPRNCWTIPLENWTTEQVHKDGAFKLSLQEYAELKKVISDMQENFYWQAGEEAEIINDFRKEFNRIYFSFLEAKELDLKLEVTAVLIENHKFDLTPIADWYLSNWHLPNEQFNEALGDFWGDVWRHAAGGAALGATAGGVGAGVPTGGAGTFAGAGLGALVGGAAGGIYGGGKSLLKHIWQWRQNQTNFETTKEKAMESLKKLKVLARGFDINPNFISLVNSMIDELGKVKAYRIAPAGASKPHEVAPADHAASPQPQPQPQPEVKPPEAKPPEPENPEVLKARQEAEAKAQAAAEEAEREKNFQINNMEDVIKIYDKAKADNDKDTLIALQGAMYYSQGFNKGVSPVTNERFHFLRHDREGKFDSWDQDTANELIEDLGKEIEKEKAKMSPAPSTGGETAEIPKSPPAAADKTDLELIDMTTQELRDYVKSKGLPQFWGQGKAVKKMPPPGGPKRVNFIKVLRQVEKNPSLFKAESAMEKYKSLVVHNHLGTMPMNERVEYLKSLLKG